jgi:hypothetical protein
MTRIASPRWRLPLLAVFAVGAVLLSAQAVWACEALDRYDQPRPCTFLEEHGECLYAVLDAHEQCLEQKESLLDGLACHVGTQVDLTICNLSLPMTLIGKLLDPIDT